MHARLTVVEALEGVCVALVDAVEIVAARAAVAVLCPALSLAKGRVAALLQSDLDKCCHGLELLSSLSVELQAGRHMCWD
jgi:hypothetical protein